MRTYTTLLEIVSFLLGTSELLKFGFFEKNAMPIQIVLVPLASKAWKPADDQYVLLTQRPGQVIRHYGKHFHCVIMAIDPILNPTGLSLSIGRRDKYTKDLYLFCSASKQRLSKTKAEGYIQVSRKLYLKQNITKEFLDRKERARKKRTPKKGGFQVGNTLYARSSVVRILFN
jgi:hypothetical protein